jgi:hypothetical protein
MKVIIYALVDPITCKVRYIGRTSVSMNARLSKHIHDAKYFKKKTHKENWIRSLLKINCKPLIRKLTEIEGWKKSYELEVSLIEKYKDRLTNYYDKGIGYLRQCREEDRIKISNTLKSKYAQGTIDNPVGKTIYVYNRNGSFHSEYVSVSEACTKLGVGRTTIKRHINGYHPLFNFPTADGRKRFLKGNYQFNTVKVDRMHDYNS